MTPWYINISEEKTSWKLCWQNFIVSISGDPLINENFWKIPNQGKPNNADNKDKVLLFVNFGLMAQYINENSKLLEPVCCKKQQKKIPDQLLV